MNLQQPMTGSIIPSEERPREPQYLAHSCTDGKQLNWDSHPDLPDSGIYA